MQFYKNIEKELPNKFPEFFEARSFLESYKKELDAAVNSAGYVDSDDYLEATLLYKELLAYLHGQDMEKYHDAQAILSLADFSTKESVARYESALTYVLAFGPQVEDAKRNF